MTAKVVSSKRIIIGADRLLGTLLVIQDTLGRPSIKFSLAGKSAVVELYDKPDRDDATFDLSKLVTSKIIPKGASLEFSYKPNNQKLEMKSEVRGGSIERSFYDVIVPAICPLFMVRVSDTSVLPRITPTRDDLLISAPLQSGDENFVVTFSLEAANGDPWVDVLSVGKDRASTTLLLPLFAPRKFFINVTNNDKPNYKGYGVSIWIPSDHVPTKVS